jgi:hypothetical protein
MVNPSDLSPVTVPCVRWGESGGRRLLKITREISMRLFIAFSIVLITMCAAPSAKSADLYSRQYGDAQIDCATWTKLSNDPNQMKKPWSENLFFRYAAWETGFVSGASAVNSGLRTTTTPEIIKFVGRYCEAHPSDSLQQAGEHLLDQLK